MTKKGWQELYETLSEIHSEYHRTYRDFEKGRNKTIRESAEKRLKILINRTDLTIRKDWEIFFLFTGEERVSDQGRTTIYDEFMMTHYFGDDLLRFLQKIRQKIESLEQED